MRDEGWVFSHEDLRLMADAIERGTTHGYHWLTEPDFEDTEKCHDWRNHVPGELQRIWSRLSQEARAAVFVCAQGAADSEDWN